MRIAKCTLLIVLLAACKPHPLPADAVVTPAKAKAPWFAPGFFLAFAGPTIVDELHTEQGGGAMHALATFAPSDSQSMEDYQQRLSGDADLALKLSSTQQAGSSLVYQLQTVPRWMSSAPGSTAPLCPDEPLWPGWATKPPAADRFTDWEALVEYTVRTLTLDRGDDGLWFQLWEEPNGPCYWSGSEADYLELYAHTAAAVKRANPNARVGGPGVSDPYAPIAPSQTPLVKALIDSAAANAVPLDFVSYHLFGVSPHQALNIGREVDRWLGDAGLPDAAIVISSYNPLDSTVSQLWPTPGTPSPTGRQEEYDTEIGAAFVPALSQALAGMGRPGGFTMYQLDDANSGGEYEADSAWGARTPEEQHGIRKALYQAARLQQQVPAPLIPVTVDDPRAGSDGALGPLGAIAGSDGTQVVMLVWSYVAAPEKEASAVVVEAGYPKGLGTWDLSAVKAFAEGTAPVSSVTPSPAEQAVLEAAKRVVGRQVDLVSRRRRLCIDATGLDRVEQSIVVDAAHNNSYAAWKSGGLNAALEAGVLTDSPELVTKQGTCWTLDVEPYTAVGLRFAASSAPALISVRVSDP